MVLGRNLYCVFRRRVSGRLFGYLSIRFMERREKRDRFLFPNIWGLVAGILSTLERAL